LNVCQAKTCQFNFWKSCQTANHFDAIGLPEPDTCECLPNNPTP